jgi:two-component system, chemotaxis family, response regulator Rcp1
MIPETHDSRPSVVLVEDHPLHARVLRRALKTRLPAGNVELFADGTTACRRLMDGEADVPDLLVLDLDLPGRSGHELLEQCASAATLREMQTVVVTSSTDPDDRARSLELGAAMHLPKPVDAAGFMQLADGLAALVGAS